MKFLLSPECAFEPPKIDGEGEEDMGASIGSENDAHEGVEEKRLANASAWHQQKSKRVCLVG